MGRKRRQLKGKDDDNSNKAKRKKATTEPEEAADTEERRTVPLSDIVTYCTERWFMDALRDAKSGDVNMQVLVGQMYYSGYGVARDEDQGEFWITRASRVRSSVWQVSNKRPGYNASDSDSDVAVGDS